MEGATRMNDDTRAFLGYVRSLMLFIALFFLLAWLFEKGWLG
jgi:hypothetical protein